MTVLASSIQSFQKGTNPIPSFRLKRSEVEKSHSTNDKMLPRPSVISANEDIQKSCEEMVYIFHSFFRELRMTSPGFYSFLSVQCRQSSSIGSRNSLLLMKDSLQA